MRPVDVVALKHWLKLKHLTGTIVCTGTWLDVVYAGLNHKILSVKLNLFLSRIWQNYEILNPQNF